MSEEPPNTMDGFQAIQELFHTYGTPNNTSYNDYEQMIKEIKAISISTGFDAVILNTIKTQDNKTI
jgi:hypothetical protein